MSTAMAHLAVFAQEESQAMSDNIRWGIQQSMRSGKVFLNCTRFSGYTKDSKGNLIIVEEEAAIVRKIFELYLRACLESLHTRPACIFSAIFCQNPR